MGPLYLVAKAGLWASGVTLGLGSALIAQAVALENAPELIGGGILATVGLVSLRLVLRAAQHERESAATVQGQLMTRIAELESDLRDERARNTDLLHRLDSERQLRISLEAAGIAGRRLSDHPADDLEIPADPAGDG